MIIIYALTAVIELLFYYLANLIISIKLLNSCYSKKRIVFATIAVVAILASEFFMRQDCQIILNTVFPIIEITILKLFSTSFDIKNVFFAFILFYFSNSILSFCIKTIFSLGDNEGMIVEIVVCAFYLFLILFVCFHKTQKSMRILIISTPTIVKVLLSLLLIFCNILVMLVGHQSAFIDYIWLKVLRLSILILVVILSISVPLLAIYSASSKYHKRLNKDYQEQITAEAEYYYELSKANFELRRFKHDYKNANIGLTRLLAEGKSKEALKLLEAQNQELDATSIQFDTGNGIVDALLTDKQRQADNINTTITFEGAVPKDSIEAVDLCIIFGNPLDNAIEACAEIDAEAPKEIHISCACNSGFIFIDITNPVKNKVEIRGNLPETTKPDKEMHGFGLYSLEKVIKKYDGEVTCECDEKTFKLSIEFSIPVKDF